MSKSKLDSECLKDKYFSDPKEDEFYRGFIERAMLDGLFTETEIGKQVCLLMRVIRG